MIHHEFDPKSITLSFSSNPKYLRLIRSIVLQSGLLMNFSEKISKDVTLAVDEALTNIIKHSYGGHHDKEIIVRLVMSDDRLDLEIRDFGKKVDPKTIKPRKLHDIKPGGLGVFFINKIMDKVSYDISPEEGTILRMTKYMEPDTVKNKEEGCTFK